MWFKLMLFKGKLYMYLYKYVYIYVSAHIYKYTHTLPIFFSFKTILFLLKYIKYLADNTVQILDVLQNDILYILI